MEPKTADELLQLIDKHTLIYKKTLDDMPVHERKVYVCLLSFGHPVLAREIAKQSRKDVCMTVAILSRLVQKGLAKKELFHKDHKKKPLIYEAIDPFGRTILGRPGIEVYWRIRYQGVKIAEEYLKKEEQGE